MEIQNYLPMAFRTQINGGMLKDAEEIRLRVGQPLEILYADEKSRKFGRISGERREQKQICIYHFLNKIVPALTEALKAEMNK